MRKKTKLLCSILMTAAAIAGTTGAGWIQDAEHNDTEEVRDYQEKLEDLTEENETLQKRVAELEGLLGSSEFFPAEDGEGAAEEADGEASEASRDMQGLVSENASRETGSVSGNSAEGSNEETVSGNSLEESVSGNSVSGNSAGEEEGGPFRVLVLGDSIWGNYRDDTGIAARVRDHLRSLGYEPEVYNAAIGGTRATLDAGADPWEFDTGSSNDLPKLLSILAGRTDLSCLTDEDAAAELAEAIEEKDELDAVIIAYGLNDYFVQASLYDSEVPWYGYGTALSEAAEEVHEICPHAEVLIAAPTYISQVPLPIPTEGEKGLRNYAGLACDVARTKGLLFLDAYHALGIDDGNAEEYIEDGVHLGEKGRDVYARAVTSCLLYGEPDRIPADEEQGSEEEQISGEEEQVPENEGQVPGGEEQVPEDGDQTSGDGEQGSGDGDQVSADGEQGSEGGEESSGNTEQGSGES